MCAFVNTVARLYEPSTIHSPPYEYDSIFLFETNETALSRFLSLNSCIHPNYLLFPARPISMQPCRFDFIAVQMRSSFHQ